jgi:hypothetical protein
LRRLRPGKVAEEPRRQRHQHVPEIQNHAPQLRRVVAPVAAACRDADQAVDLVLVLQEARQLRAQAVAQQIKRRIRQGRLGGIDHSLVVAGPIQQVGLEAAQAAVGRAGNESPEPR